LRQRRRRKQPRGRRVLSVSYSQIGPVLRRWRAARGTVGQQRNFSKHNRQIPCARRCDVARLPARSELVFEGAKTSKGAASNKRARQSGSAPSTSSLAGSAIGRNYAAVDPKR
jgi:hypothetical protein